MYQKKSKNRFICVVIIFAVLSASSLGIMIFPGVFSSDTRDTAQDNAPDTGGLSPVMVDVDDPEERSAEDVDVTVELRNDPAELGLGEDMIKTISDYFVLYQSGLGSYSAFDMSHLFFFDTTYQQLLVKSMLDYQIRLRKNMDIDLSYDKCTVGLLFSSCEETKDGVLIHLYENIYMNYAFAGDVTSYTSGVEHDFLLQKTQSEWLIVSHKEITGVYTLLTEKFNALLEKEDLTFSALTARQLEKLFARLNDSLLESADRGLSLLENRRDEFNSDPYAYSVKAEAQNPYDAQSAIDYSYQWAGKYEMKRNPAYIAYDEYGGNCNNFTSQCLFAGGIPMDTRGDIYSQWKYYGQGVSAASAARGRSMSWTGVEPFWNYCTINTGYGLCCECGDNVYSARPGDIIQYVSEGLGVHSVIVTKVVYDDQGNVIELLINSNTTDKVDCPMSIYGYTEFRIIRIIGWNN